MKDAYVTALVALAGSIVGALASFMTTWLTLNAQERANRASRAMARRKSLYVEFIEEAARVCTDALDHKLDDVSKLVHVYALASKLRLFAPAQVLTQVDDVMRQIIDMDKSPDKGFRESMERHEYENMDVLRAFSEACRKDLDF